MIELGSVQYLKQTEKGFYGFLLTSKGQLYIQESDCRKLYVTDSLEIIPSENPCFDIDIKEKDLVCFFRNEDNIGREKAYPWSTINDYNRLRAILNNPINYELQAKIHRPSGKSQTRIIWEGVDLELLKYEHGDIDKGKYVDGNYHSYTILEKVNVTQNV
jgi:hypothetical protein